MSRAGVSGRDVSAYLYAKSRLKDHIASTSALYIAKIILGEEPSGFYPVIDGVDNDELKLWGEPVDISLLLDESFTLVKTIDKIIGFVEREDENNKNTLIPLMALILLALRYTANPKEYLVRNSWISRESLPLLDKAQELLARLLETIEDQKAKVSLKAIIKG